MEAAKAQNWAVEPQEKRENLCPEDGFSKFFQSFGTYPHFSTLITGYR
jgi:hypothetical protein